MAAKLSAKLTPRLPRARELGAAVALFASLYDVLYSAPVVLLAEVADLCYQSCRVQRVAVRRQRGISQTQAQAACAAAVLHHSKP